MWFFIFLSCTLFSLDAFIAIQLSTVSTVTNQWLKCVMHACIILVSKHFLQWMRILFHMRSAVSITAVSNKSLNNIQALSTNDKHFSATFPLKLFNCKHSSVDTIGLGLEFSRSVTEINKWLCVVRGPSFLSVLYFSLANFKQINKTDYYPSFHDTGLITTLHSNLKLWMGICFFDL